jgi:protein tyrosine phosphatase (PTP) superfamily phosphohydrolase (DUF442 family)
MNHAPSRARGAFLALLVCLPFISCGGKKSAHEADIVEPHAIEGKKDLFQAGDFFFAGQPDVEMFQWLAGQGVTLVINLRTEEEMKKHMEEHYDEDSLLQELHMTYAVIPLGGDVGYPPGALEQFAGLLKKQKEKTLIHCAGAGRVSHLWMAYLVKYRDYSIDDAIDIGKKIKFRFPMEELLDTRFTIRKKR